MLARVTKQIVPGFVLLTLAFLLVSGSVLATPRSPAKAGVLAAPLARPAGVVLPPIELCASAGTVDLPGALGIPIWGFSLWSGASCGPALLPGPVLEVGEGDVVTIILHNMLSEPVALSFPGQDMVPDPTGAGTGGGTATYTFTADDPGTYLYEAGLNTDIQLPMGLYGALVVHFAPSQAYADPTTAYDTQAVLVLSEIDTDLNADPGGFDPFDPAVSNGPEYWLINGKAHPDTGVVPGAGRLLLRYVNAGSDHYTMALLGLHQRVIAKDAYEVPYPFDVVGETIPAGSTADMIVTIPSGADVGDTFPLYNRQLHLTNGASYPGGMLTFIEVVDPLPLVSITSPGDGDTVSGADVTVTATATDNGSVAQVEFFVDSVSIGVDLFNGDDSYSALWLLPDDDSTHTVTATATDDLGQTSSHSITVNVDNDANPTVSIISPTGGTVSGCVFIIAVADDGDGGLASSVDFYADDGVTNALIASGFDGGVLGPAPAPPGCWDSTTVADGAYTLTAVATDAIGQSTTSAGVAVMVDNAPFPSTAVLDDFSVGGTLGSNWSGTTGGYSIVGGQLDVGSAGAIIWNAASFGANQEAYVTLTTNDTVGVPGPTGTQEDLILKSQSSSCACAAVILVAYLSVDNVVQVWTYDSAAFPDWVQHGTDIAATYADGDLFGARAQADGTVSVYKNGVLLDTVSVATWAYYASGGHIGLWYNLAEEAVSDDFGGGTLP